MDSLAKKRITMKLRHPNPLFEQWLSEWRDKAIETDSKMQHCFGKALQSLRKYPLPLESGRDCRILQGFGEKLCQMIDRKLMEQKQKYSICTMGGDTLSKTRSSNQVKKKAPNKHINTSIKHKEYIPTWRSGSFAILITLYKKSLDFHCSGYMLKADIIKSGQHLCDKSFVKPDPGSYYTAWSSMKTLLEKHLVVKKGSPAQFSLTEEGCDLAHKLYKNYLNYNTTSMSNLTNGNEIKTNAKTVGMVSQNSLPSLTTEQITPNEMESTCLSSTSQEETFIFTPCSFEIFLLVDKQETAGGPSQQNDLILAELTNLGVKYEPRHLKVGDYTWVCRQYTTSAELILPYVVERKRMDDFGSSIKDGRFHEQKFRLKQCGIQHLVYLIENYGSNTHTGLPVTTLYQAAANTLLQDDFDVKFTNSIRGTVQYLASLTSILRNIYENKTLVSCPKANLVKSTIQDDLIPLMTFQEFNRASSKSRSFKVRELFVRQLLQLKGMSVDKALAIVEKYPTPQLLQMAYNNRPEDKEKLLSTLLYGKLSKKIGPVISRTIHQLYFYEKF